MFSVRSSASRPARYKGPGLGTLGLCLLIRLRHGGRRSARTDQRFEPFTIGSRDEARVVVAEKALALLDEWLRWARHCRIPAFVKLARSVTENRAGIAAALTHRLSNAVESINTKIRLITRVAFGFHSAKALIALAMLSLGGYCPPLPGRSG